MLGPCSLLYLPSFLHELVKDLVLEHRVVDELEVLEVFDGVLLACWIDGLGQESCRVPDLLEAGVAFRVATWQVLESTSASWARRDSKKSLSVFNHLLSQAHLCATDGSATFCSYTCPWHVLFDACSLRRSYFLSSLALMRGEGSVPLLKVVADGSHHC